MMCLLHITVVINYCVNNISYYMTTLEPWQHRHFGQHNYRNFSLFYISYKKTIFPTERNITSIFICYVLALEYNTLGLQYYVINNAILYSFPVDDLRRLIEKAGGKFEGHLYSESVTMVASMESPDEVSLFPFSDFYLIIEIPES